MDVFWVLVAGFVVIKVLQRCGNRWANRFGLPVFWIAFSVYWTIFTLFYGMPWFILPVGPIFTGIGIVMLMRAMKSKGTR